MERQHRTQLSLSHREAPATWAGFHKIWFPVHHTDFNAIPTATYHTAGSMASLEPGGLEVNARLLSGFTAQA